MKFSNHNFHFSQLLWLFALLLLGQSCVSHKELTSLNGNESVPDDLRMTKEVSNTVLHKYEPYRIRSYDQLMIRVNAFEGSTEQFLNREFSVESSNNNNIDYRPESVYFSSYIVNDSGYIVLPMVGRKKVTGLTLTELKWQIDTDYKPYLRFASSSIKLGNQRVTVLGEVEKPGVHYLYNEQNTLLDAISMAGDFTEFANRRKVKIIRQEGNNARAVYLNLNKSDFLTTEFYYIRPSDVIYVEPIKNKSLQVSSQTVGVVISAISLGTLILTLFVK